MRNFYCALNIFEQDLQPYEVKKVSCVQSRTPGRAWRSRRQCTGSPAGWFMIKGVLENAQKEPGGDNVPNLKLKKSEENGNLFLTTRIPKVYNRNMY